MVGPPHVPTLFGVFLWPKTVRCVLAVLFRSRNQSNTLQSRTIAQNQKKKKTKKNKKTKPKKQKKKNQKKQKKKPKKNKTKKNKKTKTKKNKKKQKHHYFRTLPFVYISKAILEE